MKRSAVLAVFVLFAGLVLGNPASAKKKPTATIRVTTDQDLTTSCSAGPCSLREAIFSAPSGALVKVPRGYYKLDAGNGTLNVDVPLTIKGAGVGVTTIVGNRPGDTNFTSSIIKVGNTGNLTLSGATVTGGAGTSGGGIYVDHGTLTLRSSLINRNVTSGAGGGVEDFHGTLTVVSSTIRGNRSGTFGGGINVDDGTVSLLRSEIDGNNAATAGAGYSADGATTTIASSDISNNTSDGAAGGVENNNGTVTISGSTLSGNIATNDGGAFQNRGTGSLTLTSTLVSGNTAGGAGGGGVGSAINVTSSTFSDNTASAGGGGIHVLGPQTTTIVNSTFSDNDGQGGGAIAAVDATVSVTNSTLSGNGAGNGAGIYLESDGPPATANVTSSTIAGNSADTNGGGIDNDGGTVNLTSSVLDNSGAVAGGGIDCHGTITTHGFNVVNDATDCGFTAGTHDVTGADPGLATSLALNGGPTETLAISKTGAAARNDGADPACTGHTRDQRGVKRPAHECDSGAFQVTVKKKKHR
jgi:hypothetical protein